jgi:TonB-linked SusC/RagA family outer membrane protein
MLRKLTAKVATFMIIMVTAVLAGAELHAQNRTVSGVVQDAGGAPVPGAAVLVQGNTRIGTVTDLDGSFELSIPANTTLLVDCLGYKTLAVPVGNQPRITIVLEEETTLLDETVVIGYGVQKVSDLTGAVASVRSSDLKSRSVTDAGAALQGKVAGVQVLNNSGAPGTGANIRVRGYSSNSGNLGPLLIVDGLQVDNIQYLDPSMIESMEVLKDAASAAIYGVQAGNGVILITTKTGASNQGRSSVSYEFKLTRQTLGKRAETFDAESFIAYKRASGLDIDTMLEQNKYDGTDTDWSKVVFGPSFAKQHNVTFQGGNNKGHFFAAINYVDNDGIVRGDKDVYKRLSAQFNADYRIFDWLTVGTNNSIEKWSTKSVSQMSQYNSVMNSVLTLDPLTPVYYATPDEFAPATKQNYDAGWPVLKDPTNGLYYATSKYMEDDSGNPLLQRDRIKSENGGISIRGTAFLNLTPLKGLTFTSRFGYRIAQSTSHSYEVPFYATKQAKSDLYRISANANTGYFYQWENFINYNLNIKKHSITAMAGMSYIENTWDNVGASAQGPDILLGYEENFIYMDKVNDNTDTAKDFSNNPGRAASLAYFGRLIYSYDNRYSVQANFRADAGDSSKLSKANRWGFFPSVSAGWTISNEKFIKDNVSTDILSFLKLRASWGINGNINVLGNYSYDTTINFNTQWFQYGVAGDENADISYGSVPSGLANPNLNWETSEQIDLGLDAYFLNNRLTFNMDFYNKMTRDLLVTVSPPAEVGVGSTIVNGGNVLNRGFELAIGWKDNIGDFSYSINANFSTLHNKVTYLDPSISRIEGSKGGVDGTNNAICSAVEVGYPLWYFRGYQYDGVYSEDVYKKNEETGKEELLYQAGSPKLRDVNGDGTISTDDITYIGKAMPDYTYGITLNLAWKGIDFSLFGTGVGGNDIFNVLYRYDTPMRNSLRYYYDNAWTPEKKGALMPAANLVASDANFWASSASMFSGAYFKIKQIQLGYTLPQKWTRKIFVNNFRVYVSLDDFFTITKYPGMDPETATTNAASGMGYDNGTYPTTKKLVMGVNITF